MTPARIKELREMLAKTVDRPWSVKHGRHQAADFYTVLDANGFWLADCGNDKAGAETIAVAPSALEEALDEVERLRGLVREACEMGLSAENPKATGAECVAFYERLHAMRPAPHQ